MATSLAAQLQKLAVPQTSLLQRDKKRASLLFDPKEAAAIDRDTFYEIGIAGLRELQKFNLDFAIFENNLFSSTSKNVERAVKDKQFNAKLDKNIKKFLMLLSPYFLLKPAHKALEWLINRFSIHEYNRIDFLKLIFPYYETNLFVRCLQLFNFHNENDSWHWLKPVQKSGVQLNKITLFNHAAHDVGFLKFVGKMVFDTTLENGAKSNACTNLFNFYCVTTIGALEIIHEISEPQLNAILAPLLKGLLSDIPDYTASSYIIAAQLLKKVKLSDKFLNNLVKRITSKIQKNLRMEGTLLLVLLYQAQRDHFDTIDFKSLKNVVTSDWFAVNVGKLASEGSFVLPLLLPVIKHALKYVKYQEYQSFVENIFEEVRLDESGTDALIRLVLDNCPSPQSEENSDISENEEETSKPSTIPIQKWYGNFLKKLETKYPNSFDKIINYIMSNKCSSNEKHRQALRLIMNFMMSGDSDDKNSQTLFEKLYHPNSDFRLNAVQYLIKNFNKLSTKDREILQGAINEHLLDDDVRIPSAILTLPKTNLLNIMGENNFVDISIKLLIKCFKNNIKFNSVIKVLVKYICSDDLSKNQKYLLVLLPFLFPLNEQELFVAFQILNSNFGNNYPFIANARKDIRTGISPTQFCEVMYKYILSNNVSKIDFTNEFKNLPEQLSIHKFLFNLLNVSVIKHNSDLNLKTLQNIIQFLPVSKCVKIKENEIFSYISTLRKDILPLQAFLSCLKIVIERINYPNLNNTFINLSNPDNSVKVLTTILTVLLKGCHSDNKHIIKCYSQLIKTFMNKFSPDFKQKINFLANFMTIDNSFIFKIDVKSQLRILNIINSLIRKRKTEISWTVSYDSNILIPSLLIALINPIQEIRSVSLKIMKLIVDIKTANNKNYQQFLRNILQHKDEIILDCEQLPLILFTILSADEFKDSLNSFYKIISDFNNPIHISSLLLKVLTFVNSKEILDESSKLGLNILKQSNNANIILDNHKSSAIYNVILRINENLSNTIDITSPIWEFISYGLKQDVILVNLQNGKCLNPSILILEQINNNIFTNLPENVKNSLIETFIEIAAHSGNAEVVQTVYKTIKKIDLNASLIINHLITMRDVKSNKLPPQRKFRRVSEIPTVDILDMEEWRRGITVLEFLQDKKKLTNSKILLPVLFEILKKCLDFDEQSAVEYPKQIILSAILHICNKMEGEGISLPTNTFNMELVVQCIRASQNPQTHHHALLVLAHTASLIPEQVLHNIMAIFTFMGSSVLRHDDAYSFQIIAKIIDTIIPILVNNCDNDKEKNVASVLRVFVDVILDVPEHRLMPLFKKLLLTLGTDKYLWLFLTLVFESHVLHGNEINSIKNAKNRDSLPKRLEIAISIILEFPPEVIMTSCIKLLDFIKSLPADKIDNVVNCDLNVFNIKQYSAKQYRHYKYTIVTFLSKVLSSKQLVNLLAVLTNDESLALEPVYKKLIINILTYIQAVSKIVEKTSATPQAQYWKVMIHHCYDIMDSINALLTTEMFLLVVRGLLVHNLPTVRRKAMEILNSKLQYQPSFFYINSDDTEMSKDSDLLALIPSLINIIKTIDTNNSAVEQEQELIQQTALLSLKLLIKLLAVKNPEKFIPILEFITDLTKNTKMHGNILASVLLCLSELCSKLRAHAIPQLFRYMPAVLKILKLQQSQETPGLLLLCTITTIQKIIESLPLFLSPYLEKLLNELTILSAKWITDKNDETKGTPFIKKLNTIKHNIGNLIPPRILIPAITETYKIILVNKQFPAIGPLMSILSENLSNLRGNELTSFLPDLTTFFLNALEFRNDHKTVNASTIMSVEDFIINTLTTLVLKLSETNFRPFYYKLFDWAVRGETKTERVITFYRLSYGIAENLKGLFVLFAGHFVKNAAELLDATNSIKNENNLYFNDDDNNLLLIESILKTLNAVFTYDSKNFVDKDRFETLMQPIVDQLENQTGGIKFLITRGQELVIPCIAQFAVATADDSLWKQLNYQILLKTRHNHSQIRLLSSNCLCEVARKLGEDFLPLLPETIPFLAELLEDEDENVEKNCQKVVQDLEVILGEPLQKYF